MVNSAAADGRFAFGCSLQLSRAAHWLADFQSRHKRGGGWMGGRSGGWVLLCSRVMFDFWLGSRSEFLLYWLYKFYFEKRASCSRRGAQGLLLELFYSPASSAEPLPPQLAHSAAIALMPAMSHRYEIVALLTETMCLGKLLPKKNSIRWKLTSREKSSQITVDYLIIQNECYRCSIALLNLEIKF